MREPVARIREALVCATGAGVGRSDPVDSPAAFRVESLDL
jgi:hypothetical protein